MKHYRSRLKIILDILEAIHEQGEKVSAILTYANLPYDRCMRYLEELLEKGLIERAAEGYRITERGYRFFEELKRAERLAKAFGFSL
ncbi:MAG: hypothetical protein DRN61_00415 [Thaumarchaeota archaeon]|nr:MAG: hypothetical protein DRN54_03120 [Nitrososphaerota archaeon]RLG05528.1 MAG: hypothetical protein DRN61_00415 [Nitrososphaerota archaeon]HDD42968.1 hypothetical protein [Nitrososphaeria archaeon]